MIGTLLGIAAGAVQGFFGGRIDIVGQRLIEIWFSLPELYLLIIFASIFEPSFLLLIVLLSLFGWIGPPTTCARNSSATARRTTARGARDGPHELADHLAPRAAEQSHAGDHVPAVPDERLDPRAHEPRFPRAGVPPPTRASGELLAQGKGNLDAWWISLSTFGVLVATLLLLTFMGDALRNALDTRIADSVRAAGGQR